MGAFYDGTVRIYPWILSDLAALDDDIKNAVFPAQKQTTFGTFCRDWLQYDRMHCTVLVTIVMEQGCDVMLWWQAVTSATDMSATAGSR